MKLNPSKNKPEQDVVMTPFALAKALIDYFPLHGEVLDPCRGLGAFYSQFPDRVSSNYCELSENLDFFDYTKKVDWIISNPPWSIYRKFCQHSYTITNNLVYLITINHDLGLKARLRDMKESNFGIKEIIMIDTPAKLIAPTWPQSGFQLGVCWKQLNYLGDAKISKLNWS